MKSASKQCLDLSEGARESHPPSSLREENSASGRVV